MRLLQTVNRALPGGVFEVMLQIQQSFGGEIKPLLSESRGIWASIKAAVGLVKSMFSAEVIHSHHRVTTLLAIFLGLRGKVVEHVHNEFSNWKVISFRSNHTVCVSESLKVYLENNYRHLVGKLEVVHNAVELPIEASHIEPNIDFLSVGRLVEQKNPDRYLSFLKVWATNVASPKAVWLGSGNLQNKFDESLQSFKELKNTTRISWQPKYKVLETMRKSRWVFLSSNWEGLPLVALEALSLGVPVIATQESGEIAEIISNFEAGLVWHSGETELQLVKRVREVENSGDYVRLSANARSVVTSQFGVEKFKAKLGGIYDKIRGN
jgi:glycosyltransferase involved in cell wall biosynthesis